MAIPQVELRLIRMASYSVKLRQLLLRTPLFALSGNGSTMLHDVKQPHVLAGRRDLGRDNGQPKRPFRIGGRWAVAMLVVLLSTMVVRWVGLLERSMWFDEAMSWRTSALDWPDLVDSVEKNTHAPLYFLILKSWISLFGQSLASLRTLNLAITAMTLLSLVLLFQQWGKNSLRRGTCRVSTDGVQDWTTPAFVACILFGLHPFQIQLCSNIRMYPLMVLLAILSSYALFKAIDTPERLRIWVLLSATLAAMLYTHYFALFVVAAQFAFLVAWTASRASRPNRQLNTAGAILAVLLVAGAWLPWLPVFLSQRASVANNWWTQPLGLADVRRLTSALIVSPAIPFTGALWAFAIATGTLFSTVLGLLRIRSLAALYVAWMMTAPAIGAIVYSIGNTNIVVSRYFAPVQIMWVIGFALCLTNLFSFRSRCLALAVVLSGYLTLHALHVHEEDLWNHGGVQQAMAFVDATASDGELVLVDSPFRYFPASFYAESPERTRLLAESNMMQFYTGLPVLRSEEVLRVRALANVSTSRVWVLSARDDFRSRLNSQWKPLRQGSFSGAANFQESIVVTEWVRKNSAEEK